MQAIIYQDYNHFIACLFDNNSVRSYNRAAYNNSIVKKNNCINLEMFNSKQQYIVIYAYIYTVV